MTRRRYYAFSMEQIEDLRRHYRDLGPAHFAQKWGVDISQVYSLASRNDILCRAPNGAPEWRVPRHLLPQAA